MATTKNVAVNELNLLKLLFLFYLIFSCIENDFFSSNNHLVLERDVLLRVKKNERQGLPF